MVQCEMCGAETADPTTIKIEGAELQVCSECASFGTEVDTEETTTSTSTKYSTDNTGTSSSSGGESTQQSHAGGRGSDMFDAVDELAQDYDTRLRQARENRGLTQADLADAINEKASLIRKVEQGQTLPSDDLQSKLERYLDISLSASSADGDTEWHATESTGEYTLGDVVERKD